MEHLECSPSYRRLIAPKVTQLKKKHEFGVIDNSIISKHSSNITCDRSNSNSALYFAP